MTADLSPHVSALHNALAEERPLGMREALAAGAHPMDRNADGKNVWEVLLASSSALQTDGTGANDFRQVLVEISSMPPRNPAEAMEVFAMERQAIQQKYADLQRRDVAFLRDCLSLAAKAVWVDSFPFDRTQDLVRQRNSNQAFEAYVGDQAINDQTQPGVAQAIRRSGISVSVPHAIEAYQKSLESKSAAEDGLVLQLSGEKISIPNVVGQPALNQKQARGSADKVTIVSEDGSPPNFGSLQERRALSQETNSAPSSKPGVPKP